MQPELNFSTPQPDIVHKRENSAANEAILNSQRVRLNKNALFLRDELLKGIHISGADCVYVYKILEYRARFRDLRKAGYPVQDVVGKNGAKTWFFPDEYLKSVK